MRKLSFFVGVNALGAAVALTSAVASPPSGSFAFQDRGRAQVTEAGTAALQRGTDVAAATYTLAAGGGTGWSSLPGPSVLAVTGGTLTVVRAEACEEVEYAAGKAALLPGGVYRVQNGERPPHVRAAVKQQRLQSRSPS